MGGGSKDKDQKEGSTTKNEETICKIIPLKAKKNKLDDEENLVETKETTSDSLSNKIVSSPPSKRAKKFQFKTRDY